MRVSVLPGEFVISAMTPLEPLLSPELSLLIKEFAKLHPAYADPKEAVNQCYSASTEFHEYIHGVLDEPHQVIDLTLTDDKDRAIAPEWYPNVPPDARVSQVHVVNFVDGIIIDWTSRQYNSETPFPLVFVPKKRVSVSQFL